MVENNDRIIQLLADPTRLKIYRAVLQAAEKPLSAKDIARKFGLHQNVARMHLEKLAGTGLLESRYRKSGKGGRPAKEYGMGGKVVAASYPPREYQLLADITLTAVVKGEKTETVAREMGFELGQQSLAGAGLSRASSFNSRVGSLKKLAAEQGLCADFIAIGKNGMDIRIHNCIFKELSRQHADVVCILHQQLFIGMCESHFHKVSFSSKPDIAGGGESCLFSVKLS